MVTTSSGSVPRGAGAHMLVTSQGQVRGTIGGGPMERQAETPAEIAVSIAAQLIQVRAAKLVDGTH